MDFSVIARGGLGQREFAELVGVSRVTTNLWVRGKMTPHRYTKAKIAVVLDHLQSAINNGDLPLASSVAKDKRVGALRGVVRSAVQRAREPG